LSTNLLAAITLFAIVASFTPGPNNTMLMASGANFGVRRTIPHMLGVLVGFVGLLLCIGFGLGGLFTAFPRLQDILQIGGAIYLCYLAWKLANAKGLNAGSVGVHPQTFWQAVAFQWINPKAWTMGLGAFAAYAPRNGYTLAVAVIVGVFAIVNVPCVLVWTGLGAGVSRFLHRPAILRTFNITMALLLIASLYPLAQERLR